MEARSCLLIRLGAGLHGQQKCIKADMIHFYAVYEQARGARRNQ